MSATNDEVLASLKELQTDVKDQFKELRTNIKDDLKGYVTTAVHQLQVEALNAKIAGLNERVKDLENDRGKVVWLVISTIILAVLAGVLKIATL